MGGGRAKKPVDRYIIFGYHGLLEVKKELKSCLAEKGPYRD